MFVVIGFVFVASNYLVAKKGNHWKRGDKVGKEGNVLCILRIALCCHFKNIDKIWLPKNNEEKPFTNLNGSQKQEHAKDKPMVSRHHASSSKE